MNLHWVVPGPLDQLTGGYLYDRQMIDQLHTQGHVVVVHELPGRFPEPDERAKRAAAEVLKRASAASLLIIDGLALPAFAGRLHLAQTPVLAVVHHPLAIEQGLNGEMDGISAEHEQALWRQVAGFICPSWQTRRAIMAAGLDGALIETVHPGLQVLGRRRRRSSPTPRRLLCVAIVVPRKGHTLLLAALAGLRTYDWRLDCIGSLQRDPAHVRRVRAQRQRLRLRGRVRLHGEVPAAMLRQAYYRADLFVLPSYHEGYGMALAEAVAAGVPVISTRVGAIPEAVAPGAGVLVAPGDVQALRLALQRLWRRPDHYRRLCRGAWRGTGYYRSWRQAGTEFAAALMKLDTRIRERGGGDQLGQGRRNGTL
jgi:glycosyltransferase involved in cell wall biosynthesis